MAMRFFTAARYVGIAASLALLLFSDRSRRRFIDVTVELDRTLHEIDGALRVLQSRQRPPASRQHALRIRATGSQHFVRGQ